MSFRPGDRVRGVRGQTPGEGTVTRVVPGAPLRGVNGEVVPTDATVYVEWDNIPGATTRAMRTHAAVASALERVEDARPRRR